jgi:GR25 family glycosyltransferase involved in LPS biosynthesis
MRNKWLGVLKALDQKQWQITNVVKLRVAGMEDASLCVSVEDYTNNPIKVVKYGLQDYFKGAYSYIIKPHAAKKLINFINVNGHRPADQQINSRIVNLKTTVPTIARLHPFYSIDNNIETASLTRNL